LQQNHDFTSDWLVFLRVEKICSEDYDHIDQIIIHIVNKNNHTRTSNHSKHISDGNCDIDDIEEATATPSVIYGQQLPVQ
jgi:hypothetical protein